MAELGLGQRLLLGLAERELHGLVAVALGRADRRSPTRAGLEHGDALDACRPRGRAGSCRASWRGSRPSTSAVARRISMSTPAGRWSSRWSESTVFGRRLMDVDQPLVRADLEVLARVLVLERASGSRSRRSSRSAAARAGDGRAGALGRLDDLLGRRSIADVVVGLQPDADLVLADGCHVDRFSRCRSFFRCRAATGRSAWRPCPPGARAPKRVPVRDPPLAARLRRAF